jgi:hypothetical protein
MAARPGYAAPSVSRAPVTVLVSSRAVADHHAVETPLLAQHFGEQPPVLGDGGAVQPVVGRLQRT